MNKDSKIYFYISKFSENIITHVFLKITGKYTSVNQKTNQS